jgi:HEPN domain-containing protein
MKDDSRAWLTYAGENLAAAEILLQQGLYNPCLQNVQQCVEKSLKALLFEKAHSQRKTHSIAELVRLLADHQIAIRLSEEDCDLLDSIYLPSKYPLAGVLPHFEPDASLCSQCLSLAEALIIQVQKNIEEY